jgi:hypothetical protein
MIAPPNSLFPEMAKRRDSAASVPRQEILAVIAGIVNAS